MTAPAGAAAVRLPRNFFARPTPTVARALLGCFLCRQLGGETVRARIVEVEAYTDDPASHARGGKRTPRNATMFGPAGHAYVYFTYGMHHCFNVVTEREGVPGAVLVRGLDGIANANGPARLCRVLDIDRRHVDVDLIASRRLWIEGGARWRGDTVIQTVRVGIREARELPWRFYLVGSDGVSRRDREAEDRRGVTPPGRRGPASRNGQSQVS